MRRRNDRAAWTAAILGKPKKPKRSKFNNVKTNGYDSKKEAARAAVLHALVKAGIISDLQEQVRFEIVKKCGKERAVFYVADFTYTESGKMVVEDVKGGPRTQVYIIKRKLMNAVHGIVIKET